MRQGNFCFLITQKTIAQYNKKPQVLLILMSFPYLDVTEITNFAAFLGIKRFGLHSWFDNLPERTGEWESTDTDSIWKTE